MSCCWPSVLLLALCPVRRIFLCPVVGPLSCYWPSVLLGGYSYVLLSSHSMSSGALER